MCDRCAELEAQVAALGEALREVEPVIYRLCEICEFDDLPDYASDVVVKARAALTPGVERRVAERKALEACADRMTEFVAYCDGPSVEGERPSFTVKMVQFLHRFREALAALRAAQEGQT